jgi:uncharacterized membrane protein
MSYKVSTKRHIAKTISYRLVSTGIGFAIMWLATGSIKIGAAFGIVELVYKPIQYYIHERVWYRWIKFGLVQEKKPKYKKTNSITEDVAIVVEETKVPKKKVLNYSSNR